MNEKIKTLFADIENLNKKSKYIIKILKKDEELYLNVCNYLNIHPEYETLTKLVYCICNNIILPKCKICNKQLTYSEYKKYLNAVCSNKCNKINIKRKSLIGNYLKSFKH